MMAEEVMKPRRQEEAMAQTAINQQLTTDHGSRGLCMRIRGGPCGEQRCQDPTEWRESEPRKRQKKRRNGRPPMNAGGHVRRAVENLASGRRLTGFIEVQRTTIHVPLPDHVISPAKAHRKYLSIIFSCRPIKNLRRMLLSCKIHLPSLLCSLMFSQLLSNS